MGSRNPDRVPLHMRRAKCETVVEMIDQRWDVISKCLSCGLLMQVDLKVIAIVKGPRFSLWGRSGRCKRLTCGGIVQFQARPPDLPWHEHLRNYDQPEPVPGWAERRLAAVAAEKAREKDKPE